MFIECEFEEIKEKNWTVWQLDKRVKKLLKDEML